MRRLLLCSLVLGAFTEVARAQFPDFSALSGLFGGIKGFDFARMTRIMKKLDKLFLDPIPSTGCTTYTAHPHTLTYGLTRLAPVELQENPDYQKQRLLVVTFFLDCKRNVSDFQRALLAKQADQGLEIMEKLLGALVSNKLNAESELEAAIDKFTPSPAEQCENQLAIECNSFRRTLCAWSAGGLQTAAAPYQAKMNSMTRFVEKLIKLRRVCLKKPGKLLKLNSGKV